MSGQILYIDPKDKDPQSTVRVIHYFSTTSTEVPQEEVGGRGAYGSKYQAEAIVEHPDIADIFYTFSGLHGKAGTWALYRLDLRQFNPVHASTTRKAEKLIDVPEAIWLNGATMIPQTSTLLTANSPQGKLCAFNLHTRKISTWLQDAELGKVTTRPPWPGINGLQYFRGYIFGTVSDCGTLLRMQVDKDGDYKNGSLEITAMQLTGNDMALDCEGNAYVATNPAQTVLKFAGMGIEIGSRK
ncbi:hypothetical protein EYC80_005598 [Monilinia laxa]|uniref:SMP-30/Gluconolactonase/LRE-like region domain-containing protein n=1 Tax=Monilinia laxa TaxID=61186 RepID=A0A5N6KEE1_MONLA|nr:hypothetical protein EYC80_005598 [Monilinia laxa]